MGRTYAGGLAALVALGMGCAQTIDSDARSGTSSSSGTGGTSTSSSSGTGGTSTSSSSGTSSTSTSSSSGTGGAGTSSSGTGGGCAGHVNYAGSYPPNAPTEDPLAPSAWANLPNSAGFIGLEAGDMQCQALGIGADHVCDLTEIQAASAANELLFAGIPAGTTAWMQRTTPVYVEGLSGTPCTAAMVGQTDADGDVCVLSPPGPGGRCNDWTYGGHISADGEYIVFATAGVPTYHYDNDTIWDPNMPHVHVHPTTDFACGGDVRTILCCHPSCM